MHMVSNDTPSIHTQSICVSELSTFLESKQLQHITSQLVVSPALLKVVMYLLNNLDWNQIIMAQKSLG